MTQKEMTILKKLAERFHTLPLDEGELASLLPQKEVSQAYKVLEKAIKEKVCPSLFFDGRTLVYLHKIPVKKRR